MQIKHSIEKYPAIALILLISSLLPVGGCRICSDCEDMDYPAYGGSWQRTLRNEGRVGSVFAPAGGKTGELIDRDVPPDPVELERQRQEEKENLFDTDADEPKSESDRMPPQYDSPLEPIRDPNLDDDEGENDLRKRDPEDINVNRGPSPDSPITAAISNLLPF